MKVGQWTSLKNMKSALLKLNYLCDSVLLNFRMLDDMSNIMQYILEVVLLPLLSYYVGDSYCGQTVQSYWVLSFLLEHKVICQRHGIMSS